jgi:hypothetical protein
MKVYHFVFLFWLLFVVMWLFNQVQASARRREQEQRKLAAKKS